MDFLFEFDQQNKLVIFRPFSCVDFSSIVTAMSSVIADPRFGPEFRVLIDFRELMALPTADLAISLADMLKSHRVAIVVSTAQQAASAQSLKIVASALGGNVSGFISITQAIRWVLPPSSHSRVRSKPPVNGDTELRHWNHAAGKKRGNPKRI